MAGRTLPVALVLCALAASPAWAQEAITQPLPKSHIEKDKSTIEGLFYFGENDDANSDIWGVGGQFMIGIDDRLAFNAKVTWLTDSEAGVSIDLLSVGGSLAYELLEHAGAKTVLTAFAGAGVSLVEIKVGGTTVADDTDLYIEAGLQADLNLSPTLRLVPFGGITFVFNGDTDVIFGLGGKAQLEISPTWRLTGGAVFQFDDISEAWLLVLGLTKDL